MTSMVTTKTNKLVFILMILKITGDKYCCKDTHQKDLKCTSSQSSV